MAKRAKTQTAIEPWNVAAHADTVAYDLPQYWLLVTPMEVQALQDGVVSTRIMTACASLQREVLTVSEPDLFAETVPK